jgi:methylated-DNA-[protein]-cysteine S-methyltransferase
MDYTFHYDSPLGGITLASDGEALTGLWFDGQKYFGSTLGREYCVKNLPVFGKTLQWLDLYFRGIEPGFTPKLGLRATAFRESVWNVLLTIPYGRTMTYGQIADIVAGQMDLQRMSAQAVGGAVGHNPISLIIPCHRVIGANGSLTGYAGGTSKKLQLLQLEHADTDRFHSP